MCVSVRDLLNVFLLSTPFRVDALVFKFDLSVLILELFNKLFMLLRVPMTDFLYFFICLISFSRLSSLFFFKFYDVGLLSFKF